VGVQWANLKRPILFLQVGLFILALPIEQPRRQCGPRAYGKRLVTKHDAEGIPPTANPRAGDVDMPRITVGGVQILYP